MNIEKWKLGDVIWQKPKAAQYVWSHDGKQLVLAAEYRDWTISDADYAILRVNGIKPE